MVDLQGHGLRSPYQLHGGSGLNKAQALKRLKGFGSKAWAGLRLEAERSGGKIRAGQRDGGELKEDLVRFRLQCPLFRAGSVSG